MTKQKDNMEITPAEEVLPLEEVINKELAKHNITEAIFAEMEANFLPLTIDGLNDKDGYLAVDNARKAVKNFRVAGVKICKDNRAEAIKFQKGWVEAEGKFEARAKAIEDALAEKQRVIDDEKARIKAEKDAVEQTILQERSVKLTQMGMQLVDGYYVLDDIRISTLSVKTSDSFTWSSLFAAVETKWKAKEEIRKEEERLKEEAAAAAKLLAEENLAKQEALRIQEEELKAKQQALEAAEQKQKEQAAQLEKDRQEAIIRAKEEILKSRKASLFALGFSQQGVRISFKDLFFTDGEVIGATEEEWSDKLRLTAENVAHIKETIEKQRIAELERAKQEAVDKERQRVELENIAKAQLAEKARKEEEEKKKAEELENARLAALMPNIEKVKIFLTQIAKLPLPECTEEFKPYIEILDKSRIEWLKEMYNKMPK